MKKKVNRKWLLIIPVIIVIILYFWLSTKGSVSSKNYCVLDSDCMPYRQACIQMGGCWNKNNLPEPITLPPDTGMCAPSTEITSCVCEKNRCQPIQSERNENNFYFQSCKSNNDCFPDESCLDYNTMSWHYEYGVKMSDSSNKVCYQKCESDVDCPVNMSCVTVKLVSGDTWRDLGLGGNWSDNKELADSPTTMYCRFR